MDEFLATFETFFNNAVFYYALFVMGSYVALALLSAVEMNGYMKKNSYVSYREILVSPLAPPVSILAPAYNEEATIVENIRSLLSLHYGNYEVVIINDGSKDNTFQKMFDFYHLERVDFAVDYQIPCNEIRGVYKSKLPSFAKLTVVDKVNGGKSDALNAGINVSSKGLILCIDVDCIVQEDAILKLAKPYLEEKHMVIATGGVVRIANSCKVEDGKLVEVNMPRNIWPRFQVLEYIRAFLMGRMAWSRLNGLLIISGAMGLFDKRTVIEVGGYDHSTVGEDMELVVRMRRYMHEQDRRYAVVYIPDPLCWTEAPADLQILGRQRNRWTRGTIETLLKHKDLFFNPRYGILGMLSYPYWLFFEWLAPIIEFLGLSIFIILAVTGHINWEFSSILICMVYFFSVALSTVAVLFEEMSYQQYTKGKDLVKLLIAAFLEPLLYHPLTVYWAIKGNIHKFTGKNTWGVMTRKGFSNTKTSELTDQTTT
ncbi:glycosyltransferase family 2 protein [Nubsella zeaxanthinifaciens]|uniref:glycosyltransferase family 2 protein n=1 Tax=Nubsella zeaxanthinifaciens TaxID=392412 RepID=UPI0018E53B52|nr:glycosyltransferase [Nubsella zeaxanthinifaciens]